MIYSLIRNMDSGEKRKFRLSISYKTNSNPHLEIFDLICKYPKVKEGDLKPKLSEKTLKHFTVYKNQLQEKIIQVLSFDFDKNNPRIKLNKLFIEIEFLYGRKLLKLCKKRILKAERIALKYELHEDLLKLNKWKALPALNQKYFDLEDLASLKNENSVLLDKIRENHTCWAMPHEFVALRNNYRIQWQDEAKKKLDDFISNFRENSCPSEDFNAQINYLNTHSLTSEFLSLQDEAFSYREKIGELYEANPDQIKLSPIRFLDMYFNFVISCSKTGRYKKGLEACEMMERSPEKYNFPRTEQVKSRIFEYSNSMRMILLIHSKQFDELGLIDRITQEFIENKGYIRLFTQMVMMYFFSYYYFISQRWKEVKYWLNELLIIKSDDEPEILNSARILELIMYIDLEDSDAVEARLRSYKNKFNESRKPLTIEAFVIRFAQGYLGGSNKVSWSKFLNEFESLNLTEKDEALLFTINLKAWIQSKIFGNSLMEVLKAKKPS